MPSPILKTRTLNTQNNDVNSDVNNEINPLKGADNFKISSAPMRGVGLALSCSNYSLKPEYRTKNLG
jgi:hypothetical protein